MSRSLRVALAQINPTVGDLEGNIGLIASAAEAARDAGCNLVVAPELAITGYPPEDLLLREHFLEAAERALAALAARCPTIAILTGATERSGSALYNGLALLHGGAPVARYRKVQLPNYGVFDERRYFTPGSQGEVVDIDGVRIGLSVCEDIWVPGPPGSESAAAGADLIVNVSASPYHVGKGDERLQLLAERAREHALPIAYCALVGGQDELVFDGQSLIVDGSGEAIAAGAQFASDLVIAQIQFADRRAPEADAPAPLASISTSHGATADSQTALPSPGRLPERLSQPAEVLGALELGLADYVRKNGFNGVILGVSGGIDSALAAVMAVRALGAERVHGVVMSSPWSSAETQQDARSLCERLGIESFELPIGGLMDGYADLLGSTPAGPGDQIAAENLQARIRGNLLMALSNSHGWLVITTGNKSELAVGYSTLYGDAAGGFGVLKDVPKTLVYELSRWINDEEDDLLLPSIIDRAPSAELRPDQKDEDSLPPYSELDPIIRLHVEERLDAAAISAEGHDPATVERVIGLIDRAEYKRRQYPPGVKITPLAFGRDRRMPMTNRFRG